MKHEWCVRYGCKSACDIGEVIFKISVSFIYIFEPSVNSVMSRSLQIRTVLIAFGLLVVFFPRNYYVSDKYVFY